MKRYLFLILFLVFVLNCQKIDYFAEYRGVNLIADFPLTHTGWIENCPAAYFNFESITAVAAGNTTGLPGTTDIYRLEIYNLFGNGDFENTALPGWITVPDVNLPDPSFNWIDAPDPKAIDTLTLNYQITDSEDRITYDLSSLEKGLYKLNFDFKKDESDAAISFAIIDAGNEIVTWQPYILGIPSTQQLNFQDVVSDPTFSLNSDIPVAVFSINSTDANKKHQQNDSSLDNIQIIRLDITSDITINLPYAAADPLLFPSGTYRFSLYVKEEDASQISPTVLNRFQGDSIKLSLFGINDTVDAGGSHTYTISSTSEKICRTPEYDFSSWKQIYVDGSVQVPPSLPGTSIIIRLMISPAHYNSGSLLIACPGLEFLPD